MVRRSAVSLDDIAAWPNLCQAFGHAARGKATSLEVKTFRARLDDELANLGEGIRNLSLKVGDYASFRIFDPKARTIHAPKFSERVLHHAMMGVMEPVIDRSLVFDTYACRKGKGCLAAVHRAQHHLRRYPWFVKVDVKGFFPSIHHDRLQDVLRRRFKEPGLLALCAKVVRGFEASPGRGLPIGALTSQHFANLYLAPLDRFLLEQEKVAAMVRYSDDVVWWTQTKAQAKASIRRVRDFVEGPLALKLHDNAYVQRSNAGLSFLGFRIFPGALRLSRRRKDRYRRARSEWESAYAQGLISSAQLQQGYASAAAIIMHADAQAWRTKELSRMAPVAA